MPYKARTYIELPITDKLVKPGEIVSDEDLAAAGQEEENIAQLLANGALSEDLDAEIHPDHVPAPPGTPSLAALVELSKDMVERMGDEAPKELRKFAQLDTQAVSANDSGKGVSDAG